MSPVMYITMHMRNHLTSVLISAGADFNEANTKTGLINARANLTNMVSCFHVNIVTSVLINAGADFNEANTRQL